MYVLQAYLDRVHSPPPAVLRFISPVRVFLPSIIPLPCSSPCLHPRSCCRYLSVCSQPRFLCVPVLALLSSSRARSPALCPSHRSCGTSPPDNSVLQPSGPGSHQGPVAVPEATMESGDVVTHSQVCPWARVSLNLLQWSSEKCLKVRGEQTCEPTSAARAATVKKRQTHERCAAWFGSGWNGMVR